MSEHKQRRFIPLTKWNDYHPWPSLSGLRWMVFNAEKTGFDQCLRRVGNRILINEQAFFDWVDSQTID
jgi:hypothetical protein